MKLHKNKWAFLTLLYAPNKFGRIGSTNRVKKYFSGRLPRFLLQGSGYPPDVDFKGGVVLDVEIEAAPCVADHGFHMDVNEVPVLRAGLLSASGTAGQRDRQAKAQGQKEEKCVMVVS